MLADDVHLDLVSRAQRHGHREVGTYTTNDSKLSGWYLRSASLDGREVIAAVADPTSIKPLYFIELTLRGSEVVLIRDYHHVPYITVDAALILDPVCP